MARRRYQNGWVFRRGENWILRYREDVRTQDGEIARVQRSVVLGQLKGKKEARNEAAKRLREINSGTRRPQSGMTFSDFWICYFDPEVISKRKISTQQMYRYLGEKHLLPYFGARRLCDLERGEVQDFVNFKDREKCSPQTVWHLRNILSKVFGAAMLRDFVAANLARNLEMPRMKRVRRSRVLILQEISTLFSASDEELRSIFFVGAATTAADWRDPWTQA
jgi:hypothetical protein